MLDLSHKASSLKNSRDVVSRIKSMIQYSPNKLQTATSLHSVFKGLGLVQPGTLPPTTAPAQDMSKIISKTSMTSEIGTDRAIKQLAARFYQGTASEDNDLLYVRKLAKCLFYAPYGITVQARAKAVREMKSAQAGAIDEFATIMGLDDQSKYHLVSLIAHTPVPYLYSGAIEEGESKGYGGRPKTATVGPGFKRAARLQRCPWHVRAKAGESKLYEKSPYIVMKDAESWFIHGSNPLLASIEQILNIARKKQSSEQTVRAIIHVLTLISCPQLDFNYTM